MNRANIAVIAIFLAVGGYIGFTAYEQNRLLGSIRSHVKNSSLHLANAVRYETEGTGITFKEVFQKLEDEVSEIDKRILDIQTITTLGHKEITDPVLAYMKSSQLLIHALHNKYRKRLALLTATKWNDKLRDDLFSASYYGREHAQRASDRANRDLENAVKEYNDAISEVFHSNEHVKGTYATIAKHMPAEALLDPAILDAIEAENRIANSRKKGETCRYDRDCDGTLACKSGVCTMVSMGRMQGDTCHFSGDCEGTLRCQDGVCAP